MDDIRKSIEDNYEKLKQLKDYENLVEVLNNDSKDHWWKVSTPRKEITIETDKARDKFIMFISDEICRMKTELGIKI